MKTLYSWILFFTLLTIIGINVIMVNATYIIPTYSNVTIVLKSSYDIPTYTNFTIVLDPNLNLNCWSINGNVTYIPINCTYFQIKI